MVENNSLQILVKKVTNLGKVLSNQTRIVILLWCKDKEYMITEISEIMNQTEANISAQVFILIKNGLMNFRYTPGNHGIKKLCKTSDLGNQIVSFINNLNGELKY